MKYDNIILKDATIYTSSKWKKGHIIIRDDHIEEIILGKDNLGFHSGNYEKIECLERRLLPGLYDAHTHMMEYGNERYMVDLSKARSVEELMLSLDHIYSGESFNELFYWTGTIWGIGYDDSNYSKPFKSCLNELV